MSDYEEKKKSKVVIDYEALFCMNEVKYPTDVLALDAVLGGGYERGDMIEIASESGVGKSTLMLQVVKNVLPRGEKVAYLDVERGVKSGILTNFGLLAQLTSKPGDPFVMYRPETYELMDSLLAELMEKYSYRHIFIDSLTSLMPSKLKDKGVEEIEIGLHSRLQSALLQKYKPFCRETGCCLWLVNQVRTKMESKGQGQFKTINVFTDSAGGKAVQFYPDIRLAIDKGPQLKREEKTIDGVKPVIYGNDAWLYAKKNRAERPEIKVPLTILFGRGVSNIAFLKSVMDNNKMYTSGGAYFKVNFAGTETSLRGTEEFHNWIRSNAEALKLYMKDNGMFKLTSGVEAK